MIKDLSKGQSAIYLVECFLQENYEFRHNVLSGKTEFREINDNGKTGEWSAVTYKTMNSIVRKAKMERIGKNSPRTDIEEYINSDAVKDFDPIKDYLDSLRGKYKGPSQIDMLCASLHTPKESKDTIARVSHLLRKWLIATAACALGIRQNDVALGLVGDKAGIGKTSFFEMLVPPCLNEYYQVAQKDERLFSMPNAFTQRFILNFDEFAAIGKHNEELFKMYMSANEIEIKRPGSRYAEKAPRVASCCFTSNKNQRMGGFISKPDAGLMRRLAVIEVDFIDDNRKRLDVDQLWAEAVMLLDGKYDPAWTQQEYRQFVEENRQYVIETNALRLIRIYYRKPEEGEECEFMTAMEVVLQLKKEKKISSAMQQVNEVTVGQALTALGYRYYIRRFPGKSPYHGYDIVPLYDVQQKK